jgi:hypothetical protein
MSAGIIAQAAVAPQNPLVRLAASRSARSARANLGVALRELFQVTRTSAHEAHFLAARDPRFGHHPAGISACSCDHVHTSCRRERPEDRLARPKSMRGRRTARGFHFFCPRSLRRSRMNFSLQTANSLADAPPVCYPVFMQHRLQTRSFQLHVSKHEFFRLLSYTASYF